MLPQLSSDALDDCGRGYPRPQLRRNTWYSLNGDWEFAIDPSARWSVPAEVKWQNRIRVPFAPETVASGVGDTTFYRRCWYRRRVELGHSPAGQRLFLRFGAVDDRATVWVNGTWVGHHEGGDAPFAFDVTALGA